MIVDRISQLEQDTNSLSDINKDISVNHSPLSGECVVTKSVRVGDGCIVNIRIFPNGSEFTNIRSKGKILSKGSVCNYIISDDGTVSVFPSDPATGTQKTQPNSDIPFHSHSSETDGGNVPGFTGQF